MGTLILALVAAALGQDPFPPVRPLDRVELPATQVQDDGAVILERRDLPLVRVEAVTPWPSAVASARDRVRVHVAARALAADPGLAARLDALGARLDVVEEDWTLRVGITVPRERVGEAREILGEILLEPPLSGRDLRRPAQAWRRDVATLPQSPGRLLGVAEARALYGDAHPLGRIPRRSDGRCVGPRRVRRAWTAAWTGTGTWIAGDVGLGEVAALPGRDGAARGALEDPQTGPAEVGRPPATLLVDLPGEPLSRVLVSLPVPAAPSSDTALARIAAQALGGSYTARLNQRLRAQDALTYGVWATWVDPRPGAREGAPDGARVRILTLVPVSRTGEALAALAEVLTGMGDLSDEEILRARRTLVREAAEAQVTLAGAVDRLVERDLGGGGPLAALLASEAPVDGDAVRRVARALCDPARATWIVVGDRETVEPQMEAVDRVPTGRW